MRYRVGERFGNYRVLQLLGRGGCAEVYLGQHMRVSAQWAAIKILLVPQEEIAALRQEAETVASLVHPHIIRLLDFDLTRKGIPFLVMEYAPGGSLRQRYRRGEQVTLPMVVSYVKQIASALQYAHERRIVHQDVKPENLLIAEEGSILLSDFGLAAHVQKVGQRAGGTIGYLAPEQLAQRAGPEADQYALAMTVYEWLTGECAFTGSSLSIVRKQVRATPRPLRAVRADLSVEVEEVVRRALSKAPEDRWPSVSDFAEALQAASPVSRRVVSFASVSAMPTAMAVHAVVPAQATKLGIRVSRRWLLGATVTSVGLGGSLWAWTNSRQHPGLTVHTPTPTVSAVSPKPTVGTPTSPLRTLPQVLVYRGHTAAVLSVAFSPDGTCIASASFDTSVQVWDAATGELGLVYRGHSRPLNAVAWSPRGGWIASAGNDSTVQVWDATTGERRLTYWGHFGTVDALAWSPKGGWIASAGFDQTVQVWEAASGRTVLTYQGHTDTVRSVAWSSDGRSIASASSDGTVQVWNAVTGQRSVTYRGQSSPVVSVAWSPEGARIASADAVGVQVWHPTDGARIWRVPQKGANALSWSPEGTHLAEGAADSTVQLLLASNGVPIFTYRGHSQSVLTTQYSPEGARLASAGLDSTVQVCRVS
jgi:eukaryotic-like serine/threonine-protein kinase